MRVSTATTRAVGVEILPSVNKHGIPDDDIRHAFENAVASIAAPVGAVADDDTDYVIHAMPARPKYLKLNRPHRGNRS